MNFPKANQEINRNLVTNKMILSKRFNMKSLRITASCLLSSLVAISILGIANKSVAQDGEERPFTAVMRLNRKGGLLFIRRQPTIVEKVKDDSPPIRKGDEVEPNFLENRVGELIYKARPGEEEFSKDLYPTTIVKLSNCRDSGWCRLEEIIYHEGNKKVWKIKAYETKFDQNNVAGRRVENYQAWVSASSFCDMQGTFLPLIDCANPTQQMVKPILLKNAIAENKNQQSQGSVEQ